MSSVCQPHTFQIYESDISKKDEKIELIEMSDLLEIMWR